MTDFPTVRVVFGTLIVDHCVYLTSVVEWSRALGHPGSIPVTLKIIFFFFRVLFGFLFGI